jgi:hypothetical protein
MHEVTEATLLKRARNAAAQGDWQQAYEVFVQADASQLLDGPDLALFAHYAYAAGHVDTTIDAWERVHAEGLRAGDRLMAAGAAVRVALHLLFDTALLAPIRGWARRAERLLEGQDDTPVHAWLAVVRSYERLLSGDFGCARQWARRAVDVGTGRDPAAAALGRVAEARSLILVGEVAHGVDLLNEAAVATVSGELDPLSRGWSTARSYVPCRRSRSTTSPRNGRRRWNGGARGSLLGASTDAAACTAPRSSGCAGRVSRPSRKRSGPVRSCGRTCDASSGGR